MTLIYVTFPLDEGEFHALQKKFSPFSLDFYLDPGSQACLSQLEKAEVYFGNEPSLQKLDKMARLKWLHLSSAYVNDYKLKLFCQERNILLTHSRTIEGRNLAEYVISMSNFFLKGFDCLWEGDSQRRGKSLQGSRFLQVGLGVVGSEVASLARSCGYKVWGIRNDHTHFHPVCGKTYSLVEMHSLLGKSEVICCALTKDKHPPFLFNRALLHKIKPGAVLIFLNNCELVDVAELKVFLKKGLFKAVIFDSSQGSVQSLKGMKGVFITPGIGAEPVAAKHRALDIFQRNLYHFVYGNFSHLKNHH